jgi:hypothetical protein
MLPYRTPLEIDSGRIFRWSFFVAFLVLQCIAWAQVRQVPVRRFGRRPMIAMRAPREAVRALARAVFVAGAVTLSANLAVWLILAPLLKSWLRPGFDPSAWMFHLPAGESPADSMPARWKSGGLWRPGALVLTARRIWFMPAAWDAEPWSIAHDDVERVESEPPALARILPVRNWPNLLRFTAKAGDHASLAVVDPDAVLAWFAPPRSPDAVPPGPRAAPQGVFDA